MHIIYNVTYMTVLFCRLRSAKVTDFVSALRDLHHQFEWPLPILTLTTFQQLKRKACKCI